MAKARQAETDAATAYALAVAWGNVEGEKATNATSLTAAVGHQRRQQLLITALEQELVTIDLHITEAQKERAKIENYAAHLVNTVLEEQWNEAAKALLETGGKLWAAQNMINRDPVALMKLDVPEQGEHFGSLTWRELVDRSRQHNILTYWQPNLNLPRSNLRGLVASGLPSLPPRKTTTKKTLLARLL